ncbi:MAG TPA: hypothetical protein VHN78_11155 [Chloroflexota bacterium]|nr:hypothetical protein [Chloroflexota bacterium]
MDTTTIGAIGAVETIGAIGAVAGILLAAVALAVAMGSRSAARRAQEQLAALASEVEQAKTETAALKTQLEEMKAPLERVKELDELQPRLEMIHSLAGAAADRAQRVDQRLSGLEARLKDIVPATPPPIPSSKRAPGLEDLRAVLRAQAAEGGEEIDAAAEEGERPGRTRQAPGQVATRDEAQQP